MKIYTSRYSCKYLKELVLSEQIVPIQISHGFPRWPIGFKVKAKCDLLLPPRTVFNKSIPLCECKKTYFIFLDTFGKGRILAWLKSVSDGKPVALLCFENVNAGEDCHRVWFAEWAKKHKLSVQELADE